jgi:mevalonate kinase
MRRYPAKLLLFGEYILLTGAPALAVPVPAFSGVWRMAPGVRPPFPIHDDFLTSAGVLAAGLDLDRFRRELSEGLWFDANIPAGYGLGSSGALCAAVYDRYALSPEQDLGRLKAIFSGMEGYFHGQSSGIDPLTSYLDTPLYIEHQNQVSRFRGASWQPGTEPVVFLLDSGLPRQTGPLVNWFLEQSRTPEYSRRLDMELIPSHRNMLHTWAAADAERFWPALRSVSRFQLRNMPPMIPHTLKDTWQRTLDEDSGVYLKICGAGGGGFVLGFGCTRQAVLDLAAGIPQALAFPLEPTERDEQPA